MDKNEHLDQYLDLCRSVFEDMVRDGSWPWRDSQESEDMVESEHTKKDV